ncbi:hypothetical protein COC42_11925 [Sphingomonas spermidinifaciens]|uniref:DDE domain-containing protein n=1 Tax=Sphingomonas spermidinifaciens TaxID=1141889 RepID=A0A2A4B354_9SPHN|nr:DDE-type integrase/transposase/recombinase [Sphingomonas spermidinifaciens]PCD02168.1 hypothetical protein COC42_11925 [Sphingomonas spermidinifaciens]
MPTLYVRVKANPMVAGVSTRTEMLQTMNETIEHNFAIQTLLYVSLVILVVIGVFARLHLFSLRHEHPTKLQTLAFALCYFRNLCDAARWTRLIFTRARDKKAALAFIKKALKRDGSPETITTDGLRFYGSAMDELGDREKKEMGRWAKDRAENSHLPFRRRERAMLRFRQMKSLQKFASINNDFSLERPRVDRDTYQAQRAAALPG